MAALHTVVQSLMDSIRLEFGVIQSWDLPFSASADVDLLDWLSHQTLYPQFYWQSRDGQEEAIALGHLRSFSDPQLAEMSLSGQQRVWGGRSFDGQVTHQQELLASFFFLPQLELRRTGNDWRLIINEAPQESVLTALASLSFSQTSLTAIDSTIIGRADTPELPQWSDMVNSALDAIDKQSFDKVVLARRTTLTLDKPVLPTQLLQASRQHNHDSFHFLMALDSTHSFLGSTPERLFSRDIQTFSTEALAGTIGRGRTDEEDQSFAHWLLNDKKNGYENRLVVDDLVSRLTPWCADLQVSREPELVRLRKVQHLKRHLSGLLNETVTDAQLLGCLQPTAAIAGLPREEAMQFIREKESFTRGWYSGAVGFIGVDRSEFCVAIRSALIVDDQLNLFAGAGIVPGSEALSEWQELDRKTSTLFSLFACAENVVECEIQ